MKQLWLLTTTYLAFATCVGCSTAQDWHPQHPHAEAPRVPICVQYGSKLYDRETGKECEDLHRHKPRCKAPASTGICPK